MTLDKTLKRRGRLSRSRNVLKRDERIAKLREEERWQDGRSPLGLPKVRVLKAASGKKKAKKEKEEEGAVAEGAAEAAPAAAAAPAKPAAKPAAKPGKK